MMAPPRGLRSISCGLLLLLSGCMSVGPDFKAPPAPAEKSYLGGTAPGKTAAAPVALGDAQNFVDGMKVAPNWWSMFGSARLDALVARTLENNQTLAAAKSTLQAVQKTYEAQRGSTLFPTASVNLGASRTSTNTANFGFSPGSPLLYNLYNANVAVNYNLDLFGGNRRYLESLAAQVDYQRYQLAGARLTLAANVVVTAFTQAQLAEQIDATQAMLKAEQGELDITRKRAALGALSSQDVLSLQTQVEQAEAALPPLQSKLDQTNHMLAVLAGQEPGAADIPQFTLKDFILPSNLPVVVPSELVRQRPDIQASMALLHSATAQYDVAVSTLYPQLNLSASLGSEALSGGALFGAGSSVWNVAGQLAQPLFNAGLRAGVSAAEANLAVVGANYRETVLEALRSVADALRQLDSDARALKSEAGADIAARQLRDLVHAQYQLGAASYLQLLAADQQAEQARMGLILAQATRLSDSAALFQAMGGGVLDAAGHGNKTSP